MRVIRYDMILLEGTPIAEEENQNAPFRYSKIIYINNIYLLKKNERRELTMLALLSKVMRTRTKLQYDQSTPLLRGCMYQPTSLSMTRKAYGMRSYMSNAGSDGISISSTLSISSSG